MEAGAGAFGCAPPFGGGSWAEGRALWSARGFVSGGVTASALCESGVELAARDAAGPVVIALSGFSKWS